MAGAAGKVGLRRGVDVEPEGQLGVYLFALGDVPFEALQVVQDLGSGQRAGALPPLLNKGLVV